MTEILPTPSARDFDLLRRSRRNHVWRLVVTSALTLVALFLLGLFATFVFRSQFGQPVSSQALRAKIAELRQPWSERLLADLYLSDEWFQRHGTATEALIFQGLSGMVVESLTHSNSALVAESDLSTLSRIFISLHTGIVRVLFFIVASTRMWLVVGLLALVRGLGAWKPYGALDSLGQMGNGRVFYSGAFAALEAVTPQGVPDKLIRGFACPRSSSLHDAKVSPLWQVLSEYGATNPTNCALARIIVGNRNTAPYVALAGQEEQLSEAFCGTDFVSNATALLRGALMLHSHYAAGTDTGQNETSTDAPYAAQVVQAFHTVLTPRMRTILGTVPVQVVATLVLAFECGKVLAHSYEGERWVRRSNFPHLSARAVLHSLVEFPQDYSAEARACIRRALVYAARRSPFSPIRLPVDIEDSALALRQWAEVLLACPHELPKASIELELFALVRDAHTEWRSRFFDETHGAFSLWRSNGFATRTELLFLPLRDIVRVLQELISPAQRTRLRSLLEASESAQRHIETLRREGEDGPLATFSFDRVHPFPSDNRVASLAAAHGVNIADMNDWLTLRYVLSSFGWLASRVGDYSVPETGAIFAVFQASPPLPGANTHGRCGRGGMVPLRGSKLREQLGGEWSTLFTTADRVTIAETESDFNKLLQGIEEQPRLAEA